MGYDKDMAQAQLVSLLKALQINTKVYSLQFSPSVICYDQQESDWLMQVALIAKPGHYDLACTEAQ